MKNLILTTAVLLLLSPCLASAKGHMYAEKTYQNKWCRVQGGKTEVILFDKARVDCLTDIYAIEFDFAKKWGESIGQALYYAAVTKKKPGIVLIMENPAKEAHYLNRVNTVARQYGIKVWTMTPADLYNPNFFASN